MCMLLWISPEFQWGSRKVTQLPLDMWYMVGFELGVVLLLFAVNECVEEMVKGGGVVVMARMAEFVQKDELA